MLSILQCNDHSTILTGIFVTKYSDGHYNYIHISAYILLSYLMSMCPLLYMIVVSCTQVICLIFTLKPEGKGVYIRQITKACDIFHTG